MVASDGNDTGRGSRELWLSAAHDALVQAGVDSVRIQQLGKSLNLSRTSFYWFFKDRDDLLDALLGLWREKNTGGLLRQAGAYSESVAEAILNVFDCWLDRRLFDSQFEFAVRSWALQSDRVAREIAGADEARIAALAWIFTRHGSGAAAAAVRARTIYLTQIGYISMKVREDLPTRMDRIPHYVEIFTGRSPEARELDRFYARHGYASGAGTCRPDHRDEGAPSGGPPRRKRGVT